MPGEQSKSNQRQDRKEAREAAYKYKANPYPEGSRKAKYFIKWKQHIEHMDARFDELEAVYGPLGTKRELI